MSAKDHSKISVTAKLVAYYRQFTDIPYARDVAEYIDATRAFKDLIATTGLDPRDITDYAPLFEARYQSIARRILDEGCSQVLELASGFSLRGLAMARSHGLNYVETDLADLTREKESFLKEKGIETPANHHLAVANALESGELHAAARFLDRNQRLAVVNEGLILYFSVAERERLARNVRELLLSFGGGVWITPDFSVKRTDLNISEARKRLRQAVTGVTESAMYAAAFDSTEKMEEFFRDFGFRANSYSQIDEVKNFVSLERLNLSPKILDRLRPVLKLWVLTPV